jgi:hypothetical protein
VIRTLVRRSVESIATPEQMVNAMSTFTDVATEPDLRPLAQERFALARRGMEAALDEAIARGDLAGIDAPRLAHQLHVSLVGASLVWSVTGQQSLSDELLDDLPLFSGETAASAPANGAANGKIVTLEELARLVRRRKTRSRPVPEGQLALFASY